MTLSSAASAAHFRSSVGLSPLYPADRTSIRATVEQPSGGVFVLARVSGSDVCVLSVGRSADDLGRDLVRAAKRARKYGATHFEFFPLASNLVAYALECRIFHEFRPELTSRHPEPPPGWEISCPRPDCVFNSPASSPRLMSSIAE